MAVINEDGLIGRVYEAGMDYAKIIAVIDPRSSTACLIQRTRDNGVMKGQIAANAQDSSCKMYYVPSVNDIVPGDEVITSGLDGLYPKGLVVGTVREVSRQSDTSDQYVVITPAVDFQRIEEVLVLQTVIEKAEGEILSPLPSPTTRAKPTANEPTATPDPSVTATPIVGPNNWAYPIATPDPNATSAPIAGGVRPEEQWAQNR
jgi:rod shape-determining protein MreC